MTTLWHRLRFVELLRGLEVDEGAEEEDEFDTSLLSELYQLQEKVHHILPHFDVSESDLVSSQAKLGMFERCIEQCGTSAQLGLMSAFCLEYLGEEKAASNQCQINLILKSLETGAQLQDSFSLVKNARHLLNDVDVKKILSRALVINKELYVQLLLELQLTENYAQISEVSTFLFFTVFSVQS